MAVRIRRPRGRGKGTPIVRQILDYLALRGWPAWRANCGGLSASGRPIHGNPPGTPDVLCVLPGGRLLGVEVKAPGDRLRPEQRERMRLLGEAGALMLVVGCLDALIDALGAEGYGGGI